MGLGAAVLAVGLAASSGGVPPIGDLVTSAAGFAVSPDAVAGANDWGCRPSAAHPEPVVLVHATFVNLGMNWVALSPMLANAGYCVFALNYGMTAVSAGRVGGLGDVASSAGELASFVDRVLASTGAARVDIVGHSQGGMMPSYFIKRLGGAAKVRRFVALAPSNHGTSLLGMFTLARALGALGVVNVVLDTAQAPSIPQQEAGSAFQTALFADGDTASGPAYTVIETRGDEVVTPYTNAFLRGAHDITVQDQCPADPVGHVGLLLDRPALADVMNALGPADPAFRPPCGGYGPPV